MPGTASSGGRRNNAKSKRELELDGTYRKDRHGDLKTPEPTPGQPEVPEGLSPVEQAEWDRMMWCFEDMGMLHKVDRSAVYQYCKLYAETEAVSVEQGEAKASLAILEQNIRDVEKEDLVQLFGQIVLLRKLISKCTDQLRAGRMAIRQYLVEFGLTPASRNRVKLTATADVADEFTTYQHQRGVA